MFYYTSLLYFFFFFFSSRRRHTRFDCDWSSDVCSSDLQHGRQRVQRRDAPLPQPVEGEQREDRHHEHRGGHVEAAQTIGHEERHERRPAGKSLHGGGARGSLSRGDTRQTAAYIVTRRAEL